MSVHIAVPGFQDRGPAWCGVALMVPTWDPNGQSPAYGMDWHLPDVAMACEACLAARTAGLLMPVCVPCVGTGTASAGQCCKHCGGKGRNVT